MSEIIEVEAETVTPAPANTNIQPHRRRTSLEAMAAQYGMDAASFKQTLLKTVIPQNCSHEQFAVFIGVAGEYDLNPLTKEIYAFPAKGGGIQPIVSIDGCLKIINRHPQLDGMTTTDNLDGQGRLQSITCTIYRKDRAHPISATEYMAECASNSEPWRKWPIRMLRHKATIQAARYAFGFAGIIDADEYERMQAATAPAGASAGMVEDNRPISDEERDNLLSLMNEHDINIEKFCEFFNVSAIGQLKTSDYPRALSAINKRIANKAAQTQTQPANEEAADA